ncbi:MAG: glycogen/starch synthase [Simkania negevensis]|nr:glycogen/starch synthase [Simkania negevensis]
MHIVHFATEVAPLVKVGGLADVTHGLSKALMREKEEVELLLPFYDLINRKELKELKVELKEFAPFQNQRGFSAVLWSAKMDGLSLLLLELKEERGYFNRGQIYGEKDDTYRFLTFTYVSLQALLERKKPIDILHLHDWPTAFAAPLYREVFKSRGLKIKGILLTLHNLHYQGVCSREALDALELNSTYYLHTRNFQDPYAPDQINLLKGGIIDADFLTTVSPTYAKEIQGEEGCGLETLLKERQENLKGILNGVETEYWNPKSDPFLYKNYSNQPLRIEELLEGKKENKRYLTTELKFNCDPSFPPILLYY